MIAVNDPAFEVDGDAAQGIHGGGALAEALGDLVTAHDCRGGTARIGEGATAPEI